jgi:hypothetical protein
MATSSFTSSAAILIANAAAAPLSGAVAAVHGSVTTPVTASELCGVYGQGGAGTGVLGTASLSNKAGVHGVGTSGAAGVQGDSTSGIGVYGTIPSSSAENTIAVYGLNYSTYAGPGPGAGGFAVYGLSALGHGLVGATAAAGAGAVVGATNGVAGAYAGAFYGPVVVSGAFTVFGGPKSAAVPHPDGSHRLLYCLESPESWFEDFGAGQLECGQADIKIDPDFAAVTALDDYHVFLTGYDGQCDLSVTNRTATGFRVQSKSAEAEGQFSWRIVAKRKDISAPRFDAVTIPPEPVLPPIPESATHQVPSRRMPLPDPAGHR